MEDNFQISFFYIKYFNIVFIILISLYLYFNQDNEG